MASYMFAYQLICLNIIISVCLDAQCLSKAFRDNNGITSISLHKQEHKISQYADDTTLLLKPKESVLRRWMSVLADFQSISGFQIADLNIEKR